MLPLPLVKNRANKRSLSRSEWKRGIGVKSEFLYSFFEYDKERETYIK
jgi:hypothetical protein